MLAIEIIFLVISVIGYNNAIHDNMESINDISDMTQGNMTINFERLISSQFSEVKSDLLLIAKHINPLYLSLSSLQRKSTNYFQFNKNSPLMQNLLSFNPFITYNPPNNEFKSGADSIYDSKWNQFAKEDPSFANDESKIIDKFLGDEIFNKIFVYSTDDLSGNNTNTNTDLLNMRAYTNYLITVLKSIMVRNAVYEKNNTVYKKFHIILADKYLFEYPPNLANKSSSKSELNFYSDYNSCNENTYVNCVSPRFTLEADKFNQLKENNFVAFDEMRFGNKGELLSRGCIKIKFWETGLSFACIEYTFNPLLSIVNKNSLETNTNININKYVVMFIFGKRKDTNNLDLYYSSRYNNKDIMDLRKENPRTIDLIRGLIEGFYIKKNDSVYSDNEREYNTMFSKDLKDFYDSDSVIGQLKEEYLNKNITLYYRNKEDEIRQDIIRLKIKPIFLSGSEYNSEKFIFTKNGNTILDKKPICYVMISMLYGVIFFI